MSKTNAKKFIKIFLVFMIIMLVSLCGDLSKAMATTSSNIEEKSSKTSSNNTIELNVDDEEEVTNTIRDLILTINSEEMTKSLLAQSISLYSQATQKYTNNEIASMIEENQDYFSEANVSTENLNSVISVLRNIDAQQLNKALEKIDVEQLSNKISSGASVQTILTEITGNMSTTEKVNFVIDVLLSAYVVKTALIVIIALFIYRTLLRCVIYKKAHKRAWAPFIPIYRNVVMLKICGMSPWWLLLLLVPVIGWILLMIVSVASKFMLAESFGKGTVFAFGLWLLAPIFETILVFSRKIKYVGFEEEED